MAFNDVREDSSTTSQSNFPFGKDNTSNNFSYAGVIPLTIPSGKLDVVEGRNTACAEHLIILYLTGPRFLSHVGCQTSIGISSAHLF